MERRNGINTMYPLHKCIVICKSYRVKLFYVSKLCNLIFSLILFLFLCTGYPQYFGIERNVSTENEIFRVMHIMATFPW